MNLNYSTRPFPAHPYAQAAIISFSDGTTGLLSYNTVVAEITSQGWLIVHGLYSATTRRHIGWFMKYMLDMDYATAKRLCLNNLMLNVETKVEKKWGE